MNVKEAVTAAKQHLAALSADLPVEGLRLEEFFYDDHLCVWSLTIGGGGQSRVVRVCEADKSVLSVTVR